MESLEHSMERSRLCWHAQICCWSGDIEGRSRRGTVRKFHRQQTFFTAVFAATGRNRPNWGSSAVASGVSYCCRPAIQEIGVRGGEHSSGRQSVSANLRRFSVAAMYNSRYHPPSSGFERSNAHMPVQSVFSSASTSEKAYPTKADLS